MPRKAFLDSIDVVIPTYRRVPQLSACLAGLAAQSRRPDRLIVVVRDQDKETLDFFRDLDFCLQIEEVHVRQPGVVAAMNEALKVANRDMVAVFDDDTVASSDWLARALDHFQSDPHLGAVGGRDRLILPNGSVATHRRPRQVGSIDWWGRPNGFHHLGTGPPRIVEVLKGCNMAFRGDAIKGLTFDTRLRGSGAQVWCDWQFVIAVGRRGWRIVYDPALLVEHRLGPRYDRDGRFIFDVEARLEQIHNETLCLLEYLPWIRRMVFLVWVHLIGTRDNVGLLQMVRLLPSEGMDSMRALWASQLGRMSGLRTWLALRSDLPDDGCSFTRVNQQGKPAVNSQYRQKLSSTR